MPASRIAIALNNAAVELLRTCDHNLVQAQELLGHAVRIVRDACDLPSIETSYESSIAMIRLANLTLTQRATSAATTLKARRNLMLPAQPLRIEIDDVECLSLEYVTCTVLFNFGVCLWLSASSETQGDKVEHQLRKALRVWDLASVIISGTDDTDDDLHLQMALLDGRFCVLGELDRHQEAAVCACQLAFLRGAAISLGFNDIETLPAPAA